MRVSTEALRFKGDLRHRQNGRYGFQAQKIQSENSLSEVPEADRGGKILRVEPSLGCRGLLRLEPAKGFRKSRGPWYS